MTRTHKRSRHDIAFASSTSLMLLAAPALAQFATVAMGAAQQIIDPSAKVNFEYSMLERSSQSLAQAATVIDGKLDELRQTDDSVFGNIDFTKTFAELVNLGLIDGEASQLFHRLEESGFVGSYELMYELIYTKYEEAEAMKTMAADNDYDPALLMKFASSAAMLQRDLREFEMIITMAWAKQNDRPVFDQVDTAAPMAAAST